MRHILTAFLATLTLLVIVAPEARADDKSSSSDADEKLYTTGLIVVDKEDGKKVIGILVPEWEVLVSVQAFGIDPEKVLTEDNYQIIQLVDDDAVKKLYDLEGKIVALEGRLEKDGDDQRFKVSRFVEVKDESAAKGLSAVAEESKKSSKK